MSDHTNIQTRIADDGSIETVPVTWDGEPLYSVETVEEFSGKLFAPEPFQQMRGQTSLATEAECAHCRDSRLTNCPMCGRELPVLPHDSIHCPTCMRGFRLDSFHWKCGRDES